jgi:hypothetical protein
MRSRMDQYKNGNFQRKLTFSACSTQTEERRFKKEEKLDTESGKIATK